ncbi:MAG: aspartate aminotransferase family protein [Geminicoccaceae bacterium]
MSHVFYRNLRQSYPRAAHGDGAYIVDETGKRYLDASGGAAVSCLGHSDARVIGAIKDQLDAVAFAHTGFFTTGPAEELADYLVEKAPEGIDLVYFVSGGSEAVEAALKLARQYFLEIGQPQRRRFVARRQSYHGNTLGALAVGGNQWRRTQFEPILMDADHLTPCYAYREQHDGESEDAFVDRLVRELEEHLQAVGPETVLAFIAEPVVGATLGAVPAVANYFRRIREVLDRHGILLILDEVMCGMGRTGRLFACEHDGVSPDIITIAKGLGAGYQPVGATLVSRRIGDAIRKGSGFFQHGHTYMGHPTACAAALAVQKVIEEDGLLARVTAMGDKLDAALHDRFGNDPHVGDIRGRGLFRGIELVADRQSKATFDPSLALHARIKKAAMEEGLICYPMGGTVDGRNGDHVLLAPPFIIDDAQIGELVEKLGRAVDAGLSGVRADAA